MGEVMLIISLIVMFKFLLGMVVGLYISEFYNYTFSGALDYIVGVLNNIENQ